MALRKSEKEKNESLKKKQEKEYAKEIETLREYLDYAKINNSQFTDIKSIVKPAILKKGMTIEELQDRILKTGDRDLIFDLATHIKQADVQKVSENILKNQNIDNIIDFVHLAPKEYVKEVNANFEKFLLTPLHSLDALKFAIETNKPNMQKYVDFAIKNETVYTLASFAKREPKAVKILEDAIIKNKDKVHLADNLDAIYTFALEVPGADAKRLSSILTRKSICYEKIRDLDGMYYDKLAKYLEAQANTARKFAQLPNANKEVLKDIENYANNVNIYEKAVSGSFSSLYGYYKESPKEVQQMIINDLPMIVEMEIKNIEKQDIIKNRKYSTDLHPQREKAQEFCSTLMDFALDPSFDIQALQKVVQKTILSYSFNEQINEHRYGKKISEATLMVKTEFLELSDNLERILNEREAEAQRKNIIEKAQKKQKELDNVSIEKKVRVLEQGRELELTKK